MEYRTLSTTGLRVSRLCLGTLTFGLQADEGEARRIVDRGLEAGINFIDTANVYNKGAAESILAKALAGRRHQVVLATKAGLKAGDGPNDIGLSRAALDKALEASLRRLGTDYLDLYYLHLPDYQTPIEETLAAVDEMVRAGKVRYPAVSNFAAWQICEIHALAAKNGYQPPLVSQPMYNVLTRAIEDEYLAFCKRFNVAVVTYNPLAGGLLSGKQSLERGPLPGTRFDGNRIYLDRYWHADYFAAVDELVGIARDAGKTPVELALQWVLGHPQVDAIIFGASRVGQLEENLKACEGGPLEESILARCDAVWKRLRGITPKYNR
jgi:aryl-alcohol dehydrogenase-like predicted oxidoreductase